MIEDWCTEPCAMASRSTVDENGNEVFGFPVPDRCRFEHKTLLVGTANGGQEQTDGIVYLPNAKAWAIGDRLSYEGETFKVVQRRVYRSLDGPQYQRFLVQRVGG